jgi:DNA polymerase-3 subunit epsilon
MTLIFDTETTGFYNSKLPISHPDQPRIVQLAAQLLDEDFKVRGEFNLIFNQQGRPIPEKASNVHGITDSIVETYGIDPELGLELFKSFTQMANTIVAHNIDFDNFMLRIASGDSAWWTKTRPFQFCTMKTITPICNLPGPYGPKWPTLQQAYSHCGGEIIQNAHDAMADVRACAFIYEWLMKRKTNAT